MSALVSAALRAKFEAAGQGHVFKYVDALDAAEAEAFVASLEELELDRVLDICKSAFASEEAAAARGLGELSPLPASDSVSKSAASDVARWRDRGLAAISRSEVAAVILAGGQGTRLSSTAPKGLFDIGLPSGKCLFALNADRIKRLEAMIPGGRIPLVVMTSAANDAETRAAFAANDFYGLRAEDVAFFPQGMLPAFEVGACRFLLESGSSLSWAPDGNGGIYRALTQSGTLAALEKRGVKYAHVVAVDNVLCRPCDPVFVGYCDERAVDVGSKCVWKNSPDEKVGVLCTKRGRPAVVEYSELPRDLAELRGADGELVYGAGNVCNHLLSTAFLASAAAATCDVLPFHIARKAVACADPGSARGATGAKPAAVNAVKLEAFIFDAFALAETQAVLGVDRADEFAAVKNATGRDSPESALAALCALGAKWVTAAGGTVLGDGGVEVPAHLSYAGEDLEALLKGKTFDTTKGPVLLV